MLSPLVEAEKLDSLSLIKLFHLLLFVTNLARVEAEKSTTKLSTLDDHLLLSLFQICCGKLFHMLLSLFHLLISQTNLLRKTFFHTKKTWDLGFNIIEGAGTGCKSWWLSSLPTDPPPPAWSLWCRKSNRINQRSDHDRGWRLSREFLNQPPPLLYHMRASHKVHYIMNTGCEQRQESIKNCESWMKVESGWFDKTCFDVRNDLLDQCQQPFYPPQPDERLSCPVL